MRALICGVWLSALMTWAVVLPVFAQEEPAEYRPTIELALTEYRSGSFEEALAQFRRAHALMPNARTSRGIGMADFELRNYADSIRALQQALASQVRPLEGELRAETEALLARAMGYVARVTLEVQPATATVVVDGVVVATEGGQPLLLRVGDHVLEFRAEGRVPERRNLHISGGQQLTMSVVLSEPATAQAGVRPQEVVAVSALTSDVVTRTPAEPAQPSASPLPWIVMGASGAAMITGIVLVAMAQSDIAEVEDLKDGATWSDDLQSGYDSAPLKSGIGIALIGLGAVGLGTGVWLLMTNDDNEDHDSTQVAIGLGSVAVTGHF